MQYSFKYDSDIASAEGVWICIRAYMHCDCRLRNRISRMISGHIYKRAIKAITTYDSNIASEGIQSDWREALFIGRGLLQSEEGFFRSGDDFNDRRRVLYDRKGSLMHMKRFSMDQNGVYLI